MSETESKRELGSVRVDTSGIFNTKFIYCGAGVERHDTPTIMDGEVVRYKRGHYEISASRNGVSVQWFIADKSDWDPAFETVLGWAAKHLERLSVNRGTLHSRARAIPQEELGYIEEPGC